MFANLILADEINRAPAKVQSALLEAMQEKQVTLGDQTFRLAEPFLVLATQNPIEQEGTYPLPEAQLDRFMLKVKVGYPSRDDEVKIIDRMAGAGAEPTANKVMTTDEILAAREVARQVFVDDKVKRYAVDLVAATRDPKAAEPRQPRAADRQRRLGARVDRADQGRQGPGAAVGPQLHLPARRQDHRARRAAPPHPGVSYEAEAQGKTTDHVIAQILENVPVP